jgi:hypothetical protein
MDLSHKKTLYPSRIPNGNKLIKAIMALNNAEYNIILFKIMYGVFMYEINKNIFPNKIFINGPDMDILPVVFLEAIPTITTAPGEIILKNGKNIDIKVKSAPLMLNLNSAHKPFF